MYENICKIKELYVAAYNQYVELYLINKNEAEYYRNIATGLKMALACLNQKTI